MTDTVQVNVRVPAHLADLMKAVAVRLREEPGFAPVLAEAYKTPGREAPPLPADLPARVVALEDAVAELRAMIEAQPSNRLSAALDAARADQARRSP